MPLPALFPLAIRENFVRWLYKQGASATTAYNAIRNTEYALHKSRVLEIYRNQQQRESVAAYINKLPFNYRPDPKRFPLGRMWSDNNFKYLVRFDLYSPKLKDIITTSTYVVAPNSLTRSQLLSAAIEHIKTYTETQKLVLSDWRVVEAWQRGEIFE